MHRDAGAGQRAGHACRKVTLKPGENLIARKFTYENAELWDLDNPNLYTMSVKLGDKGKLCLA